MRNSSRQEACEVGEQGTAKGRCSQHLLETSLSLGQMRTQGESNLGRMEGHGHLGQISTLLEPYKQQNP